jgi:hypothetical protein
MKLLFCLSCESVFDLSYTGERFCRCGKTKGRYCDYGRISFEGPGIPIAFHWGEFKDAANKRQSTGDNRQSSTGRVEFKAWVCGTKDDTVYDDNLRPPYTDKPLDEIFNKKLS